MRKLFLDTNIWLRFFLKDDSSQYKSVYELISQIEQGKFRVYTSNIVLLETYYVLFQTYKIPHEQVLELIDSIFEVRGITVIDRTDSRQAFQYLKKYNIKFADCLIASQISKMTYLVSFDKDFNKIREIKNVTPNKVLLL